jgi:hypothetical protein
MDWKNITDKEAAKTGRLNDLMDSITDEHVRKDLVWNYIVKAWSLGYHEGVMLGQIEKEKQ